MSSASRLLGGGVLAVVVLDVVHDLLNERYRPFEGPIDAVMHAVWVPSMLLVLVFGFALASALVVHIRARPHALRLVPFVAILGVQALLMHYRWRNVGASSYGPLTPDFLGGALVGCACVYVAHPLLALRRVRWVATLQLFMFTSGAAVCDLIWYVEGGQRGTSWLWRAPVVDLFATAYASFFSFIGSPLEPWRGWRVGVGGVLGVAAFAFVATLPRGQRRIGVSLCLAGALLFQLLASWANFIND